MLEGHLEQLKKINGYQGAAVADYTGEVLVSDAAGMTGDLGMTTATLNDIFRSAHSATKGLSLGMTHTMQIQAENAMVLMQCSGESERMHVHLFCVFAKDGNQALAKMTMNKILPEIVSELAG